MPGKKQTESSSAQAASSAVTRTIKTRRERREQVDEAERKRQRVENTPEVTHGDDDGHDDDDSEKSETRDDDGDDDGLPVEPRSASPETRRCEPNRLLLRSMKSSFLTTAQREAREAKYRNVPSR